MDEIIKLLDSNLEYISHEIINNTLYIEVASTRRTVVCQYCGAETRKVHSYYNKSFQDLPIQDHKVIITINNRKMFCNNSKCSKKTFPESFDFLSPNAKKSKRLDNEILNISMNVSSLASDQIIKNNRPS